ncbi:MAG: nodulation protein NfeD [bacterium]
MNKSANTLILLCLFLASVAYSNTWIEPIAGSNTPPSRGETISEVGPNPPLRGAQGGVTETALLTKFANSVKNRILEPAPFSGHLSSQDTTVQGNKILLIEVSGVINPVSAEYISNAVDRAEDEDFHALILQMDTPGGLLESTRQITKKFLGAKIPIIVYVAPTGARSASAGVFICYSAHLVAMAPSTNIGAAHPVNLGGSADSTQNAMMDKVTNDAVAQIKTMAEKRGRNAEWAEQAVRESVSITENEALENNVITFISPSLDSLLIQLDGWEVETEKGKATLATKDAEVISSPMSWRDRILDQISNPNLAYIFLMLGIYGIFFELSNPGAIFPGVVGAILLILAFYSMQTLPVNYAGLLLILLALLLFALEVKIASYGLLTIAGVISMAIGSLMLFKSPENIMEPMVQVSMDIVIIFTLLTAGFFVVALTFALRAHKKKVTTGSEGLVDEIGEARTNIAPQGSVSIHGEIWKAYADNEIKKGESIRVVAVEGLRLKIDRA